MRPEKKALMELILKDCAESRKAKCFPCGERAKEPSKLLYIWVDTARKEILFQPRETAIAISFQTAVGCAVCIETFLQDGFKLVTF